ncbi:SRPBCC domain-containing protein [Georgenia sp. Z1491]|uniref:SRPBCC domain-containing protein n=1 Tax=Georgenia sp. Z1491 TaxID=3416707 RepID=UPI003CECD048
MDLSEQIAAVGRALEPGDGTHVVLLQQTFAAKAAELWSAFTDPARLERWLEPVEGDLREGGRYRLTGSGTEGTIERCVEPGALDVTWEFEGDVSRLSVAIVPSGGGTTVALRHTVPDDDHWRAFGPAATGIGWDGAFLALALLLAGDPRSTPEAMGEFSTSEPGLRFATELARAWESAHLAAGADPEVARDAAARAAAFYRGEEEPG